jgi:hypothetical protein
VHNEREVFHDETGSVVETVIDSFSACEKHDLGLRGPTRALTDLVGTNCIQVDHL